MFEQANYLRHQSSCLNPLQPQPIVTLRRCQCRGARLVSRAAEDEIKKGDKEDDSAINRILDYFPALGEGLGSAVLFLLWAAVVAYALILSPNQTPSRDQYFIEKLVGLQRDDYQISTLFYCLFNAMGVYPLIFLSLLQPSAKSSNKVPLWPFTTLSFGLGFLALGPYFALWKPSGDVQTPPAPPHLEGWKNLSLKMTESTIFSLVLLFIVIGLAATAAGAALSADQWREYLHLWEESRLVNVSTLDFGLLTAFAPFWIQNDAQRRKWADGERLVPILSVIPLLGPAIYLVLRPKAK